MRVLVFESNLIWSSRLVLALKSLGHEPVLRSSLAEQAEGADAAIVNLGQAEPDSAELIRWLHSEGVPVIAHAGHKEKDLHALGKAAGADVLATNGELTHHLDRLLGQVKMLER